MPSSSLGTTAVESRLRTLVEHHWRLDYAIYNHAKAHGNQESLGGVDFSNYLQQPFNIDLYDYHPWGYLGYPFPRGKRPQRILAKRQKQKN